MVVPGISQTLRRNQANKCRRSDHRHRVDTVTFDPWTPSPGVGERGGSCCSQVSCSPSRGYEGLETPRTRSSLSLDHPAGSSGRPSPDTALIPCEGLLRVYWLSGPAACLLALGACCVSIGSRGLLRVYWLSGPAACLLALGACCVSIGSGDPLRV
ncbi:unnamed protein product [Boreogadus saida]